MKQYQTRMAPARTLVNCVWRCGAVVADGSVDAGEVGDGSTGMTTGGGGAIGRTGRRHDTLDALTEAPTSERRARRDSFHAERCAMRLAGAGRESSSSCRTQEDSSGRRLRRRRRARRLQRVDDGVGQPFRSRSAQSHCTLSLISGMALDRLRRRIATRE
jgi:hypothetical protein